MEKYTINTKNKEIQNFQQLNYLILIFYAIGITHLLCIDSFCINLGKLKSLLLLANHDYQRLKMAWKLNLPC